MINANMHLAPDAFEDDVKKEPIRSGFGRGLLTAGEKHPEVVALCADLTDSTKMGAFAKAFPERFVQVGVAEQNLVTVASGMALMGKTAFTSSYAAFSPGRNWEQIRTTICLNEANVKICGSHAGISVGPDGATHQMLEDIALMRSLPHMVVLVPCDANEAEKATLAIAEQYGPAYLRLAREKSPVITTAETPFEIGKVQVFREGTDLTIIACGIMVHEALVAAAELAENHGISAEVLNCPSIKPLDEEGILASVRKTGRVITCEEAQIAAGLGGAIAELTSEHHPVPVHRIGMIDRFGESGKPDELLEHFNLTAPHIVKMAVEFVKKAS